MFFRNFSIIYVIGFFVIIVTAASLIHLSRKLEKKAAKDVCVSLIRKYDKNCFGNYECEIETTDGITVEKIYRKDLVSYDLADGQNPYIETFFNDLIAVKTIVHLAKE